MRVIAGEYKGRRLDPIEGMDIRPTSDKVKESLFNILGAAVIDSVFLDLFGGTGGIGIEALSRGAKHVVFIDSSIKSIKVLKGNLSRLDIKDGIEVFNVDYSTAIGKLYKYGKKFDIIFVDPPYSIGMAVSALKEIDKNPILSQSGLIIVEHDSKEDMPQKVGKLYLYRYKQYGNTTLSFYTINEQPQQKEE
ncbi:MAG: 16S rRNA (guanine(966)-N(2))-methyltransferase RsmD [Clostridiaceae bacterium]|nr:16S rRNA (guanine(966)-N(2))-methyltransferase RsmD [Clostridiaceae bacterium]